MHHDEEGYDSHCVVYTTDTKTKVKLKDVKPFGEYYREGKARALACQYIVPVGSLNCQKLLDLFGLTENQHKKEYETRQRAKRKKE